MTRNQPSVPRAATWPPIDYARSEAWLRELITRVEANPLTKLHPVIEELKALIENDAEIYMLFHQMFTEQPRKPPYDQYPTYRPQVRDYRLMLACFNEVLSIAPDYQKDTYLVGFPIMAIIDWPMGTASGFTAFLNKQVNSQLCKILDVWATFLRSSASRYVLSSDPDSGWLGVNALAEPEMQDFDETFVCDPLQQYYGFRSWDDFFTRQFRPGVRPVHGTGDDRVIVNACESAPYSVQRGVKERDTFWLKGQPYSLVHMFGADGVDLVQRFVGGTVYQAFLSAMSYHRWHSPVSGKVVRTYLVPGTYYSEARVAGWGLTAPTEPQGYLTAVATRALVFIEADNADIGLMGFMAVGMEEVSTCEVLVEEGQLVRKGELIGMFHYGGSTHCLLYGPGVDVVFTLPEEPGEDAGVVKVNSAIGFVEASGRKT